MSSIAPLRAALLVALLMAGGACATSSGAGSDQPPAAGIAPDAYVEPSTGIAFPQTIGRMVRADVQEYGGALGRSVRYENRAIGVRVDCYVYDAGRGPIPDGTDADVVQQELHNAVDDVRRYVRPGGYQSASLKGSDLVAVGDSELSLLHAVLEITVNEITVESHIYLRGHAAHFLKLRVTYPLETRDYALEQVGELLDALPAILATHGTRPI